MKFLYLTLWQEEVCTDDDANNDANDDDDTNDKGQNMNV